MKDKKQQLSLDDLNEVSGGITSGGNDEYKIYNISAGEQLRHLWKQIEAQSGSNVRDSVKARFESEGRQKYKASAARYVAKGNYTIKIKNKTGEIQIS